MLRFRRFPCFVLSVLATCHLDDGMDMSVETVFQKAYLEEWQKRYTGEDNLQTSPSTTESANFEEVREQRRHFHAGATLEHTFITKIFAASSWRTRRANLALGNPGYHGLLGNSGSTVASPKTSAQLRSAKAAWSFSRSSEIAVHRRGKIVRLRGRRLIRTRWFYCVGESRFRNSFGTARGRQKKG